MVCPLGVPFMNKVKCLNTFPLYLSRVLICSAAGSSDLVLHCCNV